MESLRYELLLKALSFVEDAAQGLRQTLREVEGMPEGESLPDGDPCPAEQFERLHAAIKVYAEEFTAYERVARIGYGTIEVEVEKG